jgi:hypothetical protein
VILITVIVAVHAAYSPQAHRLQVEGQCAGEVVTRAVDLERLMLWDDRVAVARMLDSVIDADDRVVYAFVERDGRPYAHTFRRGCPGSCSGARCRGVRRYSRSRTRPAPASTTSRSRWGARARCSISVIPVTGSIATLLDREPGGGAGRGMTASACGAPAASRHESGGTKRWARGTWGMRVERLRRRPHPWGMESWDVAFAEGACGALPHGERDSGWDSCHGSHVISGPTADAVGATTRHATRHTTVPGRCERA